MALSRLMCFLSRVQKLKPRCAPNAAFAEVNAPSDFSFLRPGVPVAIAAQRRTSMQCPLALSPTSNDTEALAILERHERDRSY